MKAIVFSDWHIHNYKQFNEGSTRLEQCLNVLDDLEEFCQRFGITRILFAGDLYDSQRVILTSVVNGVISKFKDFFDRNSQIKFYAISGNHDHASKNLPNQEAITALEHLEKIFDQFILLDNDKTGLDLEGVEIHGVPYYENPEHFKQKLSETKPEGKINYLMIHQTPMGLGNEMIPTDCNPHDEEFKKFDRVFCGHIHKRQDVADNFHLVGSPIHRDMGDLGEKKGFYVINLQKPEKGLKFFHLDGYPEFKEIAEGDEIENENDYTVVRHEVESEVIENSNSEDFSTDLDNQKLLENYWNEVDGKNEELLKAGYKFIK